MRKPKISPLLIITILFSVFTLGFFLGKNQNPSEIIVSVPADQLIPPTETPVPQITASAETVAVVFPISINRADKEDLMALPGIGEILADRILDYRQENGDFTAPEELLHVEGIGKKRLEEILDFITIGG